MLPGVKGAWDKLEAATHRAFPAHLSLYLHSYTHCEPETQP